MWSTTTMETWKHRSHILCCNDTSHRKWQTLLGRVIFGDECTFCSSGEMNKHSAQIWRNENPNACVEEFISENYFVPRVLFTRMVLSSSWRGLALAMCIWIWQKISDTISWWRQSQKPLRFTIRKCISSLSYQCVMFLNSFQLCGLLKVVKWYDHLALEI